MKRSILVLFLLTFLSHITMRSQVTSVQYKLEDGATPNTYDFYLIIESGQATSVKHRAQFNSQISLVVNKGTQISILESYMPLINNHYYEGKIPLAWSVGGTLNSKSEKRDFDVVSVIPSLSPVAMYNDLNEGDEILLFTIIAQHPKGETPSVRLLENNQDSSASSLSESMGADFNNGFTIGGVRQLYKGNLGSGL